jgi:hypothetical protein
MEVALKTIVGTLSICLLGIAACTSASSSDYSPAPGAGVLAIYSKGYTDKFLPKADSIDLRSKSQRKYDTAKEEYTGYNKEFLDSNGQRDPTNEPCIIIPGEGAGSHVFKCFQIAGDFALVLTGVTRSEPEAAPSASNWRAESSGKPDGLRDSVTGKQLYAGDTVLLTVQGDWSFSTCAIDKNRWGEWGVFRDNSGDIAEVVLCDWIGENYDAFEDKYGIFGLKFPALKKVKAVIEYGAAISPILKSVRLVCAEKDCVLDELKKQQQN